LEQENERKNRKTKVSNMLRRLRLHATFGRAAEGGISGEKSRKSWKPKVSNLLRRLRLHATFGRRLWRIPERNHEKSWKTN
jgi:hypothetical protein